MGCRRATFLALIALIVSLCALALLYRLCDGRESSAGSEKERGGLEREEREREERGGLEREEREGEERGASERKERGARGDRAQRDEPTALFTHALPQYKQIGLLASAAKEPIALHGRPTRRGSDKWNYFAVSNNYAPHKLPVFVNGKDAARLLGCTELSDGDTVDVRGYGAASVSLYTLEDAEHQFRVC